MQHQRRWREEGGASCPAFFKGSGVSRSPVLQHGEEVQVVLAVDGDASGAAVSEDDGGCGRFPAA